MSDGNIFFEAWKTFVVELHQEWNQLIIIVSQPYISCTQTVAQMQDQGNRASSYQYGVPSNTKS